MARAPKVNATGLEVLKAAAERNAAVEIHCSTRNGDRAVLRTRILELDGDTVVLDRPKSDEDVPMRSNGHMEIYFVYREQLYAFDARIIDPVHRVRLAGQEIVRGVAISKPDAVRPGQRRDHFRVSLAMGEPIGVKIHRATEQDVENTAEADGGSVPIDAPHFTGMLADLSSGGVSVRAKPELARSIKVDHHVFLSFTLPGTDEPFIVLAIVRQSREITAGADIRLGLEFLPWPSERALRVHQNRLQRFVRSIERLQLKRAG